MNILIIKINPFLKEGITNVIMNLYRAMDKRDMHIDMAASFLPTQEYVDEFGANGGNIYYLERSMRHPLRYIAELAKLIKDGRYDAVHAHGSSATLALEMLAAKKAGCEVRIAHSHSTSSNFMAVHHAMKGLFRKICTHRLACGEAAGKWLYGDKRFRVINNGIDTARFVFSAESRAELRQQHSIKDNEIVIGHVGRFNEIKNQSFLVDILRELDARRLPYRLMLVGDGKLRNEVADKVRQMGLNDKVTFVGETDRVGAYLSACDLLVMPSLYEGLPLSLIEAQANGLPCVISGNITREVDKTGYITYLPLENGAVYWADMIEKTSPMKDRKTASADAIQKIKACGYDIHTEAANLKEYYRDAIEKRS